MFNRVIAGRDHNEVTASTVMDPAPAAVDAAIALFRAAGSPEQAIAAVNVCRPDLRVEVAGRAVRRSA